MLESFFFKIPDRRRKEGRRFELGYVLLFSVFAIISGSNSYRMIFTFITEHLTYLKRRFKLKWKKSPSYCTIRNIIQGVSTEDLEKAFREYSYELAETGITNNGIIAIDGKTLKGSFDNFNDKKAIHILSAFLPDSKIILAHSIVGKKTNEIPVAQQLISELNISDCIFTFDALHTQKKR